METVMPEQLGPAFDVSKVSESDRFGGTTYTIKAHFHTRDHAETVRRVLLEQALPPGPFPAQFAEQAELIDTEKLAQALAWLGCSAPTGEMLSWWVGREVNHLLDAVLKQRSDVQRTRRRQERPAADVVQLMLDALCLARPDVPTSTWSIAQDAINAGRAYLTAGVGAVEAPSTRWQRRQRLGGDGMGDCRRWGEWRDCTEQQARDALATGGEWDARSVPNGVEVPRG